MILDLHRISCDVCSFSVTDEFSSRESARRVMAGFGWRQRDDQDVCPDCSFAAGKAGEIAVAAAELQSGRGHGRKFRIAIAKTESWAVGEWNHREQTFHVMRFGQVHRILPDQVTAIIWSNNFGG